MIEDRTILKAAAPLFLSFALLILAELSARVGLADDAPKARGKDADVAKGEPGKAADGRVPADRQAGNVDAAPRPGSRPPVGRSALPRQTPSRKGTPSKKPVPDAGNAPPPGENPELDREILQALGRGPAGGPGFQQFFQGSITVNGQTQQFRGQPSFPTPGMPRNGPGMPGMPFTQFQGNFLAPALGGMRATPRKSTATPKRRASTTRKAAANPVAPRERAAPEPDPAPAPGRPG